MYDAKPHPHFQDLSRFDPLARRALSPGERVLVYGAGDFGRRLLSVLAAAGISVEALLDSDPALAGRHIGDVPIHPPQDYAHTAQVVVVSNSYALDSILLRMGELGMKNYIPAVYFFLEEDMDPSEYVRWLTRWRRASRLAQRAALLEQQGDPGRTGRLSLPVVDLVVTEKCTLKCRDCANLMQYFAAPRDEDMDGLLEAFSRLHAAVDDIFEVHILGGEPLMYRQLPQLVERLGQFAGIESIGVFSNGTLPPPPELVARMRGDGRMYFVMSDYGLPRQKTARYTEQLRGEGVLVQYDYVTQWQDCARLGRHDYTDDQLEAMLRRCCVRNSWPIKGGRLYHCPFAGSLAALRAAPPEADEGIPLLDGAPPALLREKIAALRAAKRLEACRYCGGRPMATADIPAAVQAEKALEYMTYEQ